VKFSSAPVVTKNGTFSVEVTIDPTKIIPKKYSHLASKIKIEVKKVRLDYFL